MVNEQSARPPAGTGGAERRTEAHGAWPRLVLTLTGALSLNGVVGCGDSDGIVVAAESGRVTPLATVRVPPEPPASWTLPESVRVANDGERTGLVFAPGAEAVTVSLPVPPEASGAGRISLRVLCDGDFGLSVALGGHESKVARSGDTRRLWKELQFPLPGPLAGDALTAPMRIVRVSSERPVLLEAIRFLP